MVPTVAVLGICERIGRIASMLEQAGDERTPLQRQIDWLGKVLGIDPNRLEVGMVLRLIPSKIPTIDELGLPEILNELKDHSAGLNAGRWATLGGG